MEQGWKWGEHPSQGADMKTRVGDLGGRCSEIPSTQSTGLVTSLERGLQDQQH